MAFPVRGKFSSRRTRRERRTNSGCAPRVVHGSNSWTAMIFFASDKIKLQMAFAQKSPQEMRVVYSNWQRVLRKKASCCRLRSCGRRKLMASRLQVS